MRMFSYMFGCMQIFIFKFIDLSIIIFETLYYDNFAFFFVLIQYTSYKSSLVYITVLLNHLSFFLFSFARLHF